MKIIEHRLEDVEQVACPNADKRPTNKISLIVVHNISLPAGHFGNACVRDLFCNELDTAAHTDFGDLVDLRVSSHLMVRRDGTVLQFVPFNERAWHAGESNFGGISGCNDFSIGIELEGTDYSGFREVQYRELAKISHLLLAEYAIPVKNIVGHSDIARGRKTDPGPSFNWLKFRKLLHSV